MKAKLFGLVLVLVLGGAVSGEDVKPMPVPTPPGPLPNSTDFETKYLKFIRDKEKAANELKEKVKKLEAEYKQAEKDELDSYTKFGGVEKFNDKNNKLPKPDELVKAIKAREDKHAEVQREFKTLGAISQDRRTAIKELKDKVGIVRTRELGIKD